MAIVIGIYVLGVVLGLALTDARPLGRVGLALLWPLGPLAFLVTISILVAASFVAFPAFALVAAAIVALGWWAYSFFLSV